ncbi:hypothetical protein MLD38_015497 [Melastoma candidum]|uniref:Uncharacterized protein n=1 Tax=Melastoma candidum TaxID=119954 RepID=A0ACB9RPS2_9MYRT|nr:hypothetical protein MLD38_015497 [Melastoma candidum]
MTLVNECQPPVPPIQFKWNGVQGRIKHEFEVALYTLCFFAGQEENHVELGPYQVNIKCYQLVMLKMIMACHHTSTYRHRIFVL